MQHARDLGRCGCRIGQHRLVAGDLAEYRELGVHGAGLMMQKKPALPLQRAGRACDHHHRRALGIGAGNRIDDVEGARAIGDDRDADPAMKAGRGIGGKADRRLMAQFEMRQDPRLLDRLVERQHEVARNAEDFTGAMRLERAQENGCKRGHAGSLAWPRTAPR